ncbi:aminotransferase class I/II-fold pyridoxal phosphate-dependent enzyme [Petrocella sp. FN5]|uniref:aminotransferase class I/II-fold pyridoxal phosphate-dependent enzyme n=1 Tax=Petrocella sp. FN5 TaxID=3032002 RepID=UPI0023DBC0D8|nr:aminotransferase class V-fold PLP-dependent enzyme [Petrocella sp. FN5]MDF1617597.1 aminotransferase class V-fold PLP-dependent enzyme [Petrocella sp. FN5]
MKKNLYDHLKSYNHKIYPMHMPGHKGGRYRLVKDAYTIDVTEVPGTDHLYQASGILKESMDYISKLYGTKRTIFLVNGSTMGILSAIGGIHEAEDTVLVARNCHQSVYHGITLFKLKPLYIYPEVTQFGLVGGIDPRKVEEILIANPKILSFIMTSPTYEGFISDIESIGKICNRYNVILIVDEAHGAHLPFSKSLPDSAIKLGADIVIHSMHKTLPTFTQSALMHLNLEKESERKVLRMLQMLQTSSPSYIMMAQMDLCIRQLMYQEKLWTSHLKHLEKVHKVLNKMKSIRSLNTYRSIEEGIIAKDPYKHILLFDKSDISGHDCNHLLRKKYNIQLELSSKVHALGFFSIADSKSALASYAKAIRAIDKKLKPLKKSTKIVSGFDRNQKSLEPYEAFAKNSERIPLHQSVDRIAASMITPYPPGIPMVVPGERITEDLIKQIYKWEEEGLEILGYEDEKVDVIL